jgi:hypothetical protein
MRTREGKGPAVCRSKHMEALGAVMRVLIYREEQDKGGGVFTSGKRGEQLWRNGAKRLHVMRDEVTIAHAYLAAYQRWGLL